jgi:hypothetical protein
LVERKALDAEIAGWAASVLTMTAAAMTASNLGARITGWGFVLFMAGSAAWVTVALENDAESQLITQTFLFIINLFGVWRWLGRKAQYEKGGRRAAHRSRRIAELPSLFSAQGLSGAAVTGNDGAELGTVIDAMLRCEAGDIAYVVISDGAIGGIGETLRAVAPNTLEFGQDGIRARFSRSEFIALAPIQDDAWPSGAQAV